ncbi:MAG: leucyl/phenylalanyl-tRNA--protein transferase [Mailhella sp.]|nr:leucyl/phenylalanyl-tRNA--protein transferase [Mailhella sp.]
MQEPLPWIPAGGPIWFPPVSHADGEGLLMAGGDLSPERLVEAYRRGIFPWYGDDSPILWWSPDPRCVLFPDALHVPSSLRRVMNSGRFAFSWDSCFCRVISACAGASRPGQDGTWIVPDMIEAYTGLHRAGYAHSLEVFQDGGLVGGLYGVRLGGVFFGESMFHTVPEASKAAVVELCAVAVRSGIGMIDCQQTTQHMVRFGAVEIPRADFLRRLSALL